MRKEESGVGQVNYGYPRDLAGFVHEHWADDESKLSETGNLIIISRAAKPLFF